ncbi:hypothetical protein BDN67DRAFT_986073 [Paxillus ammoniavirescens]|nr:hypothetical protein BDN67DRAFT_986073 [Paxillus ammoniavirescens]
MAGTGTVWYFVNPYHTVPTRRGFRLEYFRKQSWDAVWIDEAISETSAATAPESTEKQKSNAFWGFGNYSPSLEPDTAAQEIVDELDDYLLQPAEKSTSRASSVFVERVFSQARQLLHASSTSPVTACDMPPASIRLGSRSRHNLADDRGFVKATINRFLPARVTPITAVYRQPVATREIHGSVLYPHRGGHGVCGYGIGLAYGNVVSSCRRVQSHLIRFCEYDPWFANASESYPGIKRERGRPGHHSDRQRDKFDVYALDAVRVIEGAASLAFASSSATWAERNVVPFAEAILNQLTSTPGTITDSSNFNYGNSTTSGGDPNGATIQLLFRTNRDQVYQDFGGSRKQSWKFYHA